MRPPGRRLPLATSFLAGAGTFLAIQCVGWIVAIAVLEIATRRSIDNA